MNYLPTSIGILGTCVSVDCFEFVEHKGLVSKTEMRDFSIFNTFDKRPSFSVGKIVHSSNLHTMWLNIIWDGRFFDFLRENMGEYLLIDLADERFDLFKCDGCYFCEQDFTHSSLFDYLKSHGIEYEICSQTDFDEEEVRKRISYFCKLIKEIYPPERIILNKFFLVDKFVKNGKTEKFTKERNLKLIEKSNNFFAHWYDLLEKELPGCKTVEFSKEYLADSDHKRGLSPCHLTIDYYFDTIKQISEIVKKDYTVKRKTQVQTLRFQDTELSAEKLQELGADDYISKLFLKILQLTNFNGKTVCFIGNRVFARDFIRKLGICKFIQIYNNTNKPVNLAKRLNNFTDEYIAPQYILEKNNFAFYCGQISDIPEDFLDLCDLLIVDNMEEISELPGVLDNLYKCLKNGGELIGKTGRTWSCSSGSRWYINKEINHLKSGDAIPAFSHLLKSYGQVCEALEKYIDNQAELNNKATAILQGSGLNHLFYEDYERILQSSLFTEKRICPIFPENIPDNIMAALTRKYPQYKRVNFEYKSLYIYCKK